MLRRPPCSPLFPYTTRYRTGVSTSEILKRCPLKSPSVFCDSTDGSSEITPSVPVTSHRLFRDITVTSHRLLTELQRETPDTSRRDFPFNAATADDNRRGRRRNATTPPPAAHTSARPLAAGTRDGRDEMAADSRPCQHANYWDISRQRRAANLTS